MRTYECYAEAIKDTNDAVLCELETGDEMWIPKSIIPPDSEVRDDGDKGDLVLPLWFAEDRDIV